MVLADVREIIRLSHIHMAGSGRVRVRFTLSSTSATNDEARTSLRCHSNCVALNHESDPSHALRSIEAGVVHGTSPSSTRPPQYNRRLGQPPAIDYVPLSRPRHMAEGDHSRLWTLGSKIGAFA